ncbi:Glycosyltransferase involved in cell wall bisynthesis [Propionispira arboris]|uniref:Glycosyltransferase involved in cell wall bisynthesis n=1 Tax=Propionispira arboris TaxID=84035 RepID=A0A1H6TW60_9FIRM|nr:glycosyltransferase [Propionispira arboris]SEI84283.1 Glycosyltransferase involved in cell wall bisynthesis [Propionispira arboris]
MKVLHISEYAQGGLATYIKTLFSYDGKDNIENYLLVSEYKSDHQWNIPSDKVNYYHYKRGLKDILPAMYAIQKHIAKLQPDIIYIHSTWAGVLARFPYLFRKKNVRVLYNAHGWSFLRDTSGWKKWIYALIEWGLSLTTDAIINVSDYEYQSAMNYGLFKSKLIVIHSGISSKEDCNEVCFEVNTNKINLLFVGRFDPQKGIDYLLKEIKKCKRKDIHLYVIGDNVVSDGMGIQAINNDRVTFLGWISHDDVAAYYKACDAVIMPSRWEAFGLVAIEAMKYMKPVIVSDRGALPELVKDKVNGYVFSMDENKSLGYILENLSREKLHALGEKARQVFEEYFTDQHMLKETIEVYKNATSKSFTF